MPLPDPLDFRGIPKASAFIRSKARFPHLSGGYRSAKTTALCLKIMNDLQSYPGSISALCRNTNVQLKSTTRQVFFDILRTTADSARADRPDLIEHWSQTDNYLRFKNGSSLYFLFLEGESALENIRGLTLTNCGVDQIEQVSKAAFELLLSRISLQNGLNYVASISNPAGHNWMWKEWLIKHSGDPDWPIWIVKTMDNPFLGADFIESMLHDHNQDWVNRFVYGSFDAFGGQIYEEWNENVHVINDFDVPDEWKVGYGADFGLLNPTVFEGVAIDYDGNLIVYDEVTATEQLPEYYCKILKDPEAAKLNKHRIWSQKLKRDLPIYGDPSMVGRSIATKTNIQQEYYRQGVLIFEGNRQRTIVGVERIKDFLKVDWTKPNPYKPGSMGAPKLFVMRKCRLLIEEMPEMQWKSDQEAIDAIKNDPNASDPEEKLRKKDDHAHDALKYFILSYLAFATPKRPKTESILEAERRIFEDKFGDKKIKHWSEV